MNETENQPIQQHDFQDQRTGRGHFIGRQCSVCNRWETDESRAMDCRRPKVTVF